MKDDCIFCKLANGIIPTKSIYEDNFFNVILDTSPVSKGHALVIPKEHFDNLFELDDSYASKALILARQIAAATKEELNCDGINLLQNNGLAAGQSIFHFHIHIIPRYNDDNKKMNFVAGTYDSDFSDIYCEKMNNKLMK